VRLWNARTGEPRLAPLVHPDAVHAVAFSPDGRVLATACGDGQVRCWLARDGRPTLAWPASRDAVLALGFSPDGSLLVTADESNGAGVWQSAAGLAIGPALRHRIQEWPPGRSAVPPKWPQFSRDGRRVLTSDRRLVTVWDVASRTTALTYAMSGETYYASF